MLPPILDIYLIWHPADAAASDLASQILEHFHGTSFSGLIGGAIEVFVRSAPWELSSTAPRAIPYAGMTNAGSTAVSEYTVVVPMLGHELASALESNDPGWLEYLQAMLVAHATSKGNVGLFPFQLDPGVLDNTKLGALFGRFQQLAATGKAAAVEPIAETICRDLAQGVAQMIDPAQPRLKVFISHTKRSRNDQAEQTDQLIQEVRNVISATRLRGFFDANDLQPGTDWDNELRENAGSGAMFVIRTDLYPSREWCQREIRIAKQSGMPVLVLDALGEGEERGSFLMDHVPRMPVALTDGRWSLPHLYKAMNLLVDECLKRALWKQQERIASAGNDRNIAWWAPHAPEPVTIVAWIESQSTLGLWPPADDSEVVILHPDPPLGADERLVIDQIVRLSGFSGTLGIMTPRMFAARGG
jgi:hypothetical protein